MDERTLSFINLYAVLGALTELCRLDEESLQRRFPGNGGIKG